MSVQVRRIVVVVALAVVAVVLPAPNAAAVVPSENFRLGPDPTVALLEAPSGPFGTDSIVLTDAQTPGFGSGTLWFPTTAGDGPFGAIAVLPGFTGNENSIRWFGPLLSSHGFVVLTATTNNGLDFPDSRATQFLAMLDYLASGSNPVRSRVDADRLGVIGHSMGGGGAIEATSRRPSIKASVPLTPWHGTKTWPQVQTPTMVLGAQNDSTASVSAHAQPLYNGLPAGLAKSYPEIRGAGHSVPTSGFNPLVARLTVSWMKRFMDEDYRYDQFHCPTPQDSVTFSQYWSTCPYWTPPPPPPLLMEPGEPGALDVVAGDGSVSVSWSVPADSGSAPVLGYLVEVTSDPSGQAGWSPATGSCAPEVTRVSSATSCVVGGLANGVAVRVRVAARNDVGSGPFRSVAGPLTPSGRPGAPTGVTVEVGDQSATVSWLPPATDGGRSVEGYLVEASPGQAGCSTGSAAERTCQVVGLVNGTSYTFTVQARNANGTGGPSLPSQPVTPVAPGPPPAPPQPPGEVRAWARTGMVTVTWTVAQADPDAPVVGYRVMDEQGAVVCETGAANSCDVVGLDPATFTTFRVLAVNLAGVSDSSGPTRPVLPGVCGTTKGSFVDVAAGAYFAAAAECLLARGITTNTRFTPTGVVTRGQMAAFLWRLNGEPEVGDSCGFRDEASIPAFARQGACWLLAQGITTNNPFNAAGTVNRGQMAAFLWRLAGEPPSGQSCGFRDEASIPAFARQGACWLLAQGITTNNPFNAAGVVNRGQMAAFLVRTGAAKGLWVAPSD
jgi:hypothetical protein